MAKSKPLPGTIGLKLLSFSRARIQRYVPPAAAAVSPSNSALPASWQQAAEEPLVWQADPDSEPLTPVMEAQPEIEPEAESPQQESGIAPHLLRLLDMHEAQQTDAGTSDGGAPAISQSTSNTSQPVMRKAAPKSRPPVPDQRPTNRAPQRRISRQEIEDDAPSVEAPSLDDPSFTANTYTENVMPRIPSGEVHEVIKPRGPRPSRHDISDEASPAPQVDSYQSPTSSEPIQRQVADEYSEPGFETPEYEAEIPQDYAQEPATYFDTDVAEPRRSEPTVTNTPTIQRTPQDSPPAQTPSAPPAPSQPRQPSNPYFQVVGMDEEMFGDTEPINYSPDAAVQRAPAEPTAPPSQPLETPQQPAPSVTPPRQSPRLDAIQRSVESVEKNLEAVQRNLDSIQRFVDGGKPGQQPTTNDTPSNTSKPQGRIQRQPEQPAYSQLDMPQQALEFDFDGDSPEATTPYTPIQADHQAPPSQINLSSAEPDAPVMRAPAQDVYESAPEEQYYQDYSEYQSPEASYDAPEPTWSDNEQEQTSSYEPPTTSDAPPVTPSPRQAPRQIVQAKRVPVNRPPIQRVEDYSEDYAADAQAEPDYDAEAVSSSDASVPESGSPEADLLTLLNLPPDTPVTGLRSSQPSQSIPNANAIRRKAAHPENDDQSWQGEIEISEPYNETDDDDYTPLPSQIQPVSLDQVLTDNRRPNSGDTPVQRSTGYTEDTYEPDHQQPVSLDQALLGGLTQQAIQRAETNAPAEPSSNPEGHQDGQNAQAQGPNVDKLAREVYRLLRDKLRIEQERRSNKS